MQILRKITIGLFSLVCVATIAMLIYLGTLQLTIYNRATVKSWLEEGGVYKNNLVPSLLKTESQPSESSASVVTTQIQLPPSVMNLALERTFTKDFVRNQTESTIDDFYDWLEGKSQTFTFSIPIQEKRDTFIAELSRAAESHIAALPVCSASIGTATACRPANIAPDLYAKQVITESVQQSDFFKKPIQLQPDASSGQTASQPPEQFRQFAAATVPMMISLIVIAIVSVIAILWLNPPEQRLKTLSKLGKRIFFGQIFIFVASLALVWGLRSGSLKLPTLAAQQPAVLVETFNSVLVIAFVDILGKLALLSGIVCALSLGVWIGIRIWQSQRAQVEVIPRPPMY